MQKLQKENCLYHKKIIEAGDIGDDGLESRFVLIGYRRNCNANAKDKIGQLSAGAIHRLLYIRLLTP